jgi:hypothetical protein
MTTPKTNEESQISSFVFLHLPDSKNYSICLPHLCLLVLLEKNVEPDEGEITSQHLE